jgi:hypothetical protein
MYNIILLGKLEFMNTKVMRIIMRIFNIESNSSKKFIIFLLEHFHLFSIDSKFFSIYIYIFIIYANEFCAFKIL